jgi:hypothetical protein
MKKRKEGREDGREGDKGWREEEKEGGEGRQRKEGGRKGGGKKMVGRSYAKTSRCISKGTEIRISKKHLNSLVLCSINHSSQDLETIQVSINR